MSATATTKYIHLRARASVVADFDVSDLVTEHDDVNEVLDFLDEDCEQVETPVGTTRWMLKDSRRKETLAMVSRSELRKLRAQGTVSDPTRLQAALDRSLQSGWTEDEASQLDLADARAVSVVAGWWDGARKDVPTPHRMVAEVGRLSLFGDVRTMADNHFVGRAQETNKLRKSFRFDRAPVLLHGLGGRGKSALIARHIVWAVDDRGAKVALLDFDDPTLDPFNPAKLAERIIDLITRQLNLGDHEVRTLRASASELATFGGYELESNARRSATIGDWGALIRDLVLVAGHGKQILVVLDTFEQVQRQGPSAVHAVTQLVDELLRWPLMRIVVSGRTNPHVDLPGTPLFLGGLAESEAVQLLTELAPEPVAESTALRVVKQVGTSPLTIRLAARLLADLHDTDDLLVLGIKAEQVDAELYHRVLAHIPDRDVRSLAHPGLVLRRISVELIRDVLAGPCGVSVPDVDAAESLLDRLAREVMLVDRDGDELVHRWDVRQMMLPQLLLDRPRDVRRIQESAVRFYAERDGLPDRVEELYHRLMLGQSAEALSERWDERAASRLVVAKDELPDASRRFLLAQLSDQYLSDEDRRMVSDGVWMAKVEPQVLRLLDTAEVAEALQLLWERRGPAGESLFPDLEIEALEAGLLFAQAMQVARLQRRSAAERAHTADVVTYTLHLVRLLERTDQPDDAQSALDETMALIISTSIDRLRLLVAWLGVDRRAHDDDVVPRAEYVRECLDLYDRIGQFDVQKVRGLLRDLAAEVGAESTQIVLAALRAAGVNAREADLIPRALRQLAESVAAANDSSADDVANLVRVGHWTDILDGQRDVIGRALADVLETYGDSANVLSAAVAAEYQREADAAYFAHIPNQEREGIHEDVAYRTVAFGLAKNPNPRVRSRAIEATVAEGERILRLGLPGTAKVCFQSAAYAFAGDTDPEIKQTVNALRSMIVDLAMKRFTT
jgi:hypothetical protein